MKRTLPFVILIFILMTQVSQADIPETISYQGLLTDATSTPVADGTYSLSFGIYEAETGGTASWTEAHASVAVDNGIFNVILGSNTPLTIAFDKQYWLEVEVNGAVVTPRIKLTSASYSLNARSVTDGAVTENKIAVNAVTTSKIHDNAVTGIKIPDGHLVRSINTKTDDVALIPGTNIAITPIGNTLIISAAFDGWNLTGNAGTTAGTNFLGTTNNVALELRVNNLRILCLEPHATCPNLIGGYSGNSVTSGVYGATISGGGESGSKNIVSDDYGTVGGGRGNQAGDNIGTTEDACFATVGGGRSNRAIAYHTTIGGGGHNRANAICTTISGGYSNEANGYYATIGGGESNFGRGNFATISGGSGNQASADFSTVGGGMANKAIDASCAIGGGGNNQAGSGGGSTDDARYATVGGGWMNTASGASATVPGGANNTAHGNYSFAAGRQAKASHDGTFVWGDSTYADIESTANDQFLIRASGGMWIYSNSGLTSGVRLSGGSSALATVSDRAMKRNIRQVDVKDILSRLSEVPISRWNYKTQSPGIEHIGPMAQDFYAAFGLDEDDKHISTVDADGVALAAIQGLYELVKEKDAQIAALEARLEALEEQQKD